MTVPLYRMSKQSLNSALGANLVEALIINDGEPEPDVGNSEFSV